MADKISETGLWIDDESGKVVKSKPRGGATQVVREGGRITPAAKVLLDALDADPDAKPISAAVALGNPEPDVAPVDEPKTVTTAVAKKATPKR